MKQIIICALSCAIIGITSIGCGKVGDAPEAKTGEAVDVQKTVGGIYTIDTSKSSIGWKAAKITRAHDGGFHTFDGTVTVDGDSVTAVNITIDAASIWTDPDDLTRHLKSDDFFAVDKYPTATFETSQLVKTDSVPGATHIVTGNLTIRGNKHSVAFPATINVGPQGVTAKADFKINRKDWGIVYPGAPDDLIRDDVRIIFDITAIPSAPQARL